MELGNFLGKLKGNSKTEPKKFLALVLTDEVVQSSVWSVINGQTEIIAVGSPVEWDGDTGTTGELITAVDATISSAVEGLEDEPSEVILGIPHSWTDKDGILGVKRDFITKIRKELELTAIGYVVITDSILSYLKMQEGTPTTSILIQVSRDELTLVLVKLGRIEAIETIGRSDDVVEDVTEGIARFKVLDNLPSRIILFNSMHNLDDLIQNLLSFDWQSQFNFLHTPKIEALPKDVTIRALSVAGGSEVAKSLGISLGPVIPSTMDQSEEEVYEEASDQDSDPDAETVSDQSQEEVQDLPSVPPPSTELLSGVDFGFKTISANGQGEMKPNFVEIDDEPELTDDDQMDDADLKVEPKSSSPRKVSLPKISLPSFKIPTFKFQLPKLKAPIFIVGAVLILLAVLAYFLIWQLPHAVITASVIPKNLDQNVEITLSTTDSDINFTDKIVPAKIEVVQSSGEKTVETTGKKTVGELATGEVTIYNRTSASKNFPKGTSLSVGSLKFALDQDTTVASKSAGSDYVDVPGKATVKITASSIGKESNIASGTEFTVLSFGKDSYVAKNDSGLTGGTSEEVQVVGKEDQTKLTSELTAEILEQLKNSALTSSVAGTGVYLIADSAKVDEVEYSAKVGETSKSLTASLTIKATLLKYLTDDVATLVNSAIDQAVPSGYVRANLPSSVDLTASKVSDDETSVDGTAKVQVYLLPVLNQTQLQTYLKGRKTTELESVLTQLIPGFSGATVSITPKGLPTRFKAIPQNPKNITVNITPKQAQ